MLVSIYLCATYATYSYFNAVNDQLKHYLGTTKGLLLTSVNGLYEFI